MTDRLALELPDTLVEAIARRAAVLVADHVVTAPEPWLDVSQAAAHLSCKPQRIYDLVSRKDSRRLPHRKEGGRLLFRASELDRYVERGGSAR